MKGKRCFCLLLALFIMLGLSLSVSSDTFAKQYDLPYFLVHPVSIPGSPNSDWLTYEMTDTTGITPMSASYLSVRTDMLNDGKCVYYDYVHGAYTISSSLITFGGTFLAPFPTPYDSYFYSQFPFSACDSAFPFGHSNDYVTVPDYDDSSTPFAKSLNVSSMLPFRYIFNSMPLYGTRTSDGAEMSRYFELSEPLNSLQDETTHELYSDKISSVKFPINFNSSIESLRSGTSVTYSGAVPLPLIP